MLVMPNLHTKGEVRVTGEYYPATETMAAFTAARLVDNDGEAKSWTLFVETPEHLARLGERLIAEAFRLANKRDELIPETGIHADAV